MNARNATIRTIAALAACLLLNLSASLADEKTAQSDEYLDFNPGKSAAGGEWVQAIVIKSPELRSDVRGSVKVEFQAPGMSAARAYCWQQPTAQDPNPWGHDVLLADLKLDADGGGSFVFPADSFPNGPVTIRITAHNPATGKRDVRELQLFNTGGVAWKQGIPKTDPPAAKGMKLAFADDFDGPLSISGDGTDARYAAHKPGGGDFSGWPFSNPQGPLNPFGQRGTYLRIRASKPAGTKGSTGLLASIDVDGTGRLYPVPCYFECRFIAQSAIGTWPAFWTLTKGDWAKKDPTDELDIVEAYGGVGKGNPNHPGYSITSHFWGSKDAEGKPLKAVSKRVPMMELGGRSYWSTTFHTYAVKVTATDTTYYLDDIEVLRHPSGQASRTFPHFFLINYAIGGISGWPIDLEREGNATDMYVDYVRVYANDAVDFVAPQGEPPTPGLRSVGLNFSVAGDTSTELKPEDTAGAAGAIQGWWNNLPGAGGKITPLKDQSGKEIPALTAAWSVPGGDNAGRSKAGREWGFTGSNLRLQKGYIQGSGSLLVSGIPYPKYDVYVYIGADDNGGKGSVTIASDSGAVDPSGTYFYNLGWLKGSFVRSSATDQASATVPGNYVVFTGNTARSFTLNWTGSLERGLTGVTGIQIVAAP